MIFQHFNLLSSRTAFDNVALPLEIAGIAADEIKRRVAPLLDLVGLSDKRDRYPSELSGGQKQRVGIARALATQPKVLLCDEATSALDPETDRIDSFAAREVNTRLGVTIVLITHEIPVIQAICNRVAVIEAGRIIEEAPVLDLFLRPRHPTTELFVRSVTGLELPPHLAATLRADPFRRQGDPADRILRRECSDTDPSRLSALVGADINLLAGRIGTLARPARRDTAGGRPYGRRRCRCHPWRSLPPQAGCKGARLCRLRSSG